MSRLIPLIVIPALLVTAPVAHAQEVKTFDCAAYGTGCENRIPATGTGGAGSFMTPSVIAVPAGLNPNCVIEDLDVSIMIEHPARGDLVVALQGPDGTSVALWSSVGGISDHFQVTIDDEAATQIQVDVDCAGGTYCFGTFAPTAPASLGDFDGLNPAGDWTLTIEDIVAGGTGFLRGWSLRMTFVDTDGDQVFDCDDVCPNDTGNDVDNDGLCADVDNCPTVANTDQADADGNGVGNACEPNPNPCGMGVAGAGILALSALCALKLAGRQRR